MRYRTGDYLAILPRNPAAVADRALRRFALAIDAQLVIRSTTTAAASLPTGYPISARTLLLGYFELAQPATRAQLKQLAAVTGERAEREELERLSEPGAYEEAVLAKRWSVLDLIVRARSCSIPFAQFLAMLPLLRPRQYSISSSPMIDEEIATLTVAVVDAEALSGQGRYQGVASTFLASLQPGDRLPVVVRPSQAAFRPPEDPRVPMVMVCAGTGIAPFRGFLQERSAQRSAGREVAKSLLFFGMDHPDVDFLYRDEMERWEIEGVVEVRTAFSAKPEGDVSFVQHRIWEDRDEVARYFREGAQFYVCGDGKYMAPAVRETFIRIYQTTMEVSEDMARRWADRMEHEHGRYVADVFL
jgi:cytochrome P450/NADPH-cytochrome P450 reductase